MRQAARYQEELPGATAYRYFPWIEQALAPIWDGLDERMKEHLVGGLSLCMDIEALVVLRDICGIDSEQAVEFSRWAAQAILRAGLEKSLNDGGSDRR